MLADAGETDSFGALVFPQYARMKGQGCVPDLRQGAARDDASSWIRV